MVTPAARHRRSRLFAGLCLAATVFAVLMLAVLLVDVFVQGLPWLSGAFLTHFTSFDPHHAGVRAALAGTCYLMLLVTFVVVPVGVGAALWLEEYAPRGRVLRAVQLNIANLAGVPSVLYGIFGLALFVRFLAFDRSLLAGALTLTLLVLPIVVIATQEALRAVPQGLRESAFALGATRWQVVWHHLLPAAAPGLFTGVILALARALGETAPLLVLGGFVFIAFTPGSLFDPFTALPLQIYHWTALPQQDFRGLAAAAIVVLMGVMLLLNLAAFALRRRYDSQRPA